MPQSKFAACSRRISSMQVRQFSEFAFCAASRGRPPIDEQTVLEEWTIQSQHQSMSNLSAIGQLDSGMANVCHTWLEKDTLQAWERVLRFRCGILNNLPTTTVHRGCDTYGFDVSDSSADDTRYSLNSTGDGRKAFKRQRESDWRGTALKSAD